MTIITDQLLDFIFDGKSHILFQPVESWLTSSRRYCDFVDNYKDKIRKKIRTTQNTETLIDLQLELETAYLLLQEQRLSLVYEPGLAEKVRRPDFAVSYTTSLTFMIEVTRVRVNQPNIDAQLMDPIFSKLGQLLPKHSNILIIGIDKINFTSVELAECLIRFQRRIEQEDRVFLNKYGFRDRSEFFQQHQRLSEIVIRESIPNTKPGAVAWINPQARQPLPSKARTALYRSHAV